MRYAITYTDAELASEEWASVSFHPDYEVSNIGRVRSRDTFVWAGPRAKWRKAVGRILKPGLASNGYPTVVLGRVVGTKTVHSLVASAFVGPIPEGCEVRHKDGNRQNPRASNLHYGTRSDNVLDAFKHGTRDSEMSRLIGLKAAATKDARYGPEWRKIAFQTGGFASLQKGGR